MSVLVRRQIVRLLKTTRTQRCAALPCAVLCMSGWVRADPVPVRFMEGAVHGFLALRNTEGKVLASGDLTQVVKGDRGISHLRFRFRDGSIDDETATFTQHGTFRLVSDRHVQKGPTFPTPVDVSIKAASGEVTVRYEEHGKEKVDVAHLDIPADVTNGIILDVLKNIEPGTKETTVSYIAASPKPRVVRFAITPESTDPFWVVGEREKAVCYRIKVELGGIAGLLAPLVGKQPADAHVWIAEETAPAFVKSEQPLYLGGPLLRIEMTSPVWRTSR